MTPNGPPDGRSFDLVCTPHTEAMAQSCCLQLPDSSYGVERTCLRFINLRA